MKSQSKICLRASLISDFWSRNSLNCNSLVRLRTLKLCWKSMFVWSANDFSVINWTVFDQMDSRSANPTRHHPAFIINSSPLSTSLSSTSILHSHPQWRLRYHTFALGAYGRAQYQQDPQYASLPARSDKAVGNIILHPLSSPCGPNNEPFPPN